MLWRWIPIVTNLLSFLCSGVSNKNLAAVGGVCAKELNEMERAFLALIDFDLLISPKCFADFCEEASRLLGRSISSLLMDDMVVINGLEFPLLRIEVISILPPATYDAVLSQLQILLGPALPSPTRLLSPIEAWRFSGLKNCILVVKILYLKISNSF